MFLILFVLPFWCYLHLFGEAAFLAFVLWMRLLLSFLTLGNWSQLAAHHQVSLPQRWCPSFHYHVFLKSHRQHQRGFHPSSSRPSFQNCSARSSGRHSLCQVYQQRPTSPKIRCLRRLKRPRFDASSPSEYATLHDLSDLVIQLIPVEINSNFHFENSIRIHDYGSRCSSRPTHLSFHQFIN